MWMGDLSGSEASTSTHAHNECKQGKFETSYKLALAGHILMWEPASLGPCSVLLCYLQGNRWQPDSSDRKFPKICSIYFTYASICGSQGQLCSSCFLLLSLTKMALIGYSSIKANETLSIGAWRDGCVRFQT